MEDMIDEDVSSRPLAAAIVAFVVSAFFFVGRLASRRIKRHPFDASDYTLLLGMICGWGVFAVVIYGSCAPEANCRLSTTTKVLY